MVLGRKFGGGGPDKCGHWGFLVKWISRYWVVTLRNRDGLRGLGQRDPQEESRGFHLNRFSSLGKWTESQEGRSRKSATELGTRLGNRMLRNGEGSGEDLQLCYLPP